MKQQQNNRSQSSEKSGQMFHSRLDNRVQALNNARVRGGAPGQTSVTNSANISSANRPMVTQDDSAVAARGTQQNSGAKGKGSQNNNRLQ